MNHFTVRCINFRAIVIAISFLISSTNIYSQYHEFYLSNGEHIRLDNPKGAGYSVITKDGKIQSVHKDDPEEVIRIIVTFKDQPLAAYQDKQSSLQKTSLASVYASLQASHTSFRQALSTLRDQLSVQLNSDYSYTITRDYYRALNGVALECKRIMINKIRSLPMVKHVSPDREVKAHLKESVHQIRADIVQDSLGYKGKGVLVGEIDTGIDYDNPVLGGGFGPGFRVIGGHDFINSDNDPMDDHGHGTHVAGIIGANGGDTLRGVAPEVKFLAVKVLNANGTGSVSGVIAGIEYCLDPDNNPATDDAVDIINMSLGTTPEQDSPLDLAVNNASYAGILSVVAAGNEGCATPFNSPYQTIASPGTAETALTVGACDKSDVIAEFSSKGPDPIHFAMKPELVAPGVDILSAKAGGGTSVHSGTSMAAPHVSGVAALLKQQHPDWTPEQLKAAIVNSATSIGDSISPYVQGNGRVDALQAATTGITVQPGIISFGLVDLAADVWKDTVTFKIRNLRNSLQQITLNPQHNLPSGAGLSIDQNNFTLAPMEENTVTAIISVSKSVPIVEAEPFAYAGNIICQSDSDRIRVPFGFIKSNVLVIESDLEPVYLYLWEPGTAKINLLTSPVGKKQIVTIETGNYNLLAQLGYPWDSTFYFIERKEIQTGGLNYIALNHNEAIYQAFNNHNQIYDINNRLITELGTCDAQFTIENSIIDPITKLPIGVTLGSGFRLPLTHLYTSPLDSSCKVTEQIYKVQGDDAFALYQMSDGLQSQNDLVLPSGPDQLAEFYANFIYKNPSSADYVPYLYSLKLFGGSSFTLFGIPMAKIPTGHIIFNKDQRFDAKNFCSISLGIDLKPDLLGSSPFVMTSDIRASEQGEIILFDRKPHRPDDTEIVPILSFRSGDTLQVDEHYDRAINLSVFQLQQTENTTLYLSPSEKDIYFDGGGVVQPCGMRLNSGWPFLTSFRASFNPQLFINNKLLKGTTGSFTNFDNFYYKYDINDSKKVFRLSADGTSYKLLGQSGQTTIYYNIKSIDPVELNPNIPVYFFAPSLDLMQIIGNGEVTSWLRPGQAGNIRLVIFDPKTNVNAVGLYLLADNGTETMLQTVPTSNKEYLVSIPDNLATGFWDVVARVENEEGNSFEVISSPAFYYGSSLDSIQLDSRLRLSTFKLDNLNQLDFQAGDTLKYSVTYKNYGNISAQNVTIDVPETDYLKLSGALPAALGEIKANATAQIPVDLLIKENPPTDNNLINYPLTVSWTSNGKILKRTHCIPVDLSAATTYIANNKNDIPETFALSQNYPNPFNPTTTIKYDLPKQSGVKIVVYDILGREVATLVNEIQKAGSYQVVWNANRLASGVYFYRLKAGGYSATKKLLFLK
jgi:subtilisin family serine protease